MLYQVVSRAWPKTLNERDLEGESVSPYVRSEFDRYRKCGILDHGFVRLLCPSCEAERLVAYSCKTRGFCPSCGSRRREQTADRLESDVWPNAKARQWVLTFPHQVRYWLARSPELFVEVIREVTREISYFYESSPHAVPHRSPELDPPATGAITFLQFFGSSLALNPHLHMVFLDGVFHRDKTGMRFYQHPGLITESMFDVLEAIHMRLHQLFRDKGYVKDDGEASIPNSDDQDVDATGPFRPRAPKAFRRQGRLESNPRYQLQDPDRMSVDGWCNIKYKWFSLHAAVTIDGSDRAGLKQLFRYASRSSVNISQLSYVTPDDPDRSDVMLKLKRTWSDGTSSLIFKQQDFVESLASIIPPAWLNLTRYSGVFAPGHAWRATIVPGKKRASQICHDHHPAHPEDLGPRGSQESSNGRAPADHYIEWAELLRRTMGIDPEICGCGQRMRVVDSVTKADEIRETLLRLGIESTGPPKARQSSGELDYIYDV